MPRQTRRHQAREANGVLCAVSEEHDDAGRLTRRVKEFFPPDMEPDEMRFLNRITRREVETYEYRVATLDVGDGQPPQYVVHVRTDIFTRTPSPDDALRLTETRSENLSPNEAQRREAQTHPPRLRVSGAGFIRHALGWPLDVWRSPRRPPENPAPPSQRPHPDPLIQRGPRPLSAPINNIDPGPLLPMPRPPLGPPPAWAVTAMPDALHPGYEIISYARAPNSFEVDEDDLVASTNARAALRSRNIPDPNACALSKGCQGYCETCKRCTLHCTCPKIEPPTGRRIRA